MNIRNQVQLIGNVGGTPEIKELSNDKSLARFSVATQESYKDTHGNWVNKTDWHQVVAWGSSARNVEKLLDKGVEVALQGKLATRQWEDKNGEKRYTTEVILNEFTLVGKKKEAI